MRTLGICLAVLALLTIAWVIWTTKDEGVADTEPVERPDAADATEEARLLGRETSREFPARPTATEMADETLWQLTGRVLDPDGEPVPRAQVTAWLDPGGGRSVLGTTTSRDDGSYALSLDGLSGTSRALRITSALVARASRNGFLPGHEAEVRPLPIDIAHGVDLALELSLAPGGRVVGSVTGRGGTPLADVSVHLVTPNGESLEGTDTDATGTFALGFVGEQVVEVWATSSVHGLARSGSLRPDPEGTTEVGPLVLVAGEAITGRVLYEDGTGIAGIWIYADLEVAMDDPFASVSSHVVREQVWAETDAQGRFAVQTPRPGTYQLHLSDSFPMRLLGVTAASGDTGVEIVLALHKLVVQVKDAQGRPLPGCLSQVSGYAKDDDTFDRIVRGEMDAGEQARSGAMATMAGSFQDVEGRIQLLVPPGSGWVFVFDLEGLPALEHAVRVPEEGHETHVDLVAGVAGPAGTLELVVLDEYDKPIEVFDFELTSRLGSRLGSGGSAEPDTLRGLPAGPAKLTVHPGPARHLLDRRCQILSPYFPLHTDVEIPENDTARVTLRARRGGWIRLTPELEGDDLAADALGGVRVDVRPEGSDGPWTYAWMFLYGEGENLRGTSVLAPNVPTRVGQLFEPGRTELRLLGHGVKPVTVPVTVVAGQEVAVTVRVEKP